MKEIEAILEAYDINEAYYKLDDKLELVIVSRSNELSLSSWFNMINNLKLDLRKEVEFLSLKEAKKIYGNLDLFTSFGGASHE